MSEHRWTTSAATPASCLLPSLLSRSVQRFGDAVVFVQLGSSVIVHDVTWTGYTFCLEQSGFRLALEWLGTPAEMDFRFQRKRLKIET